MVDFSALVDYYSYPSWHLLVVPSLITQKRMNMGSEPPLLDALKSLYQQVSGENPGFSTNSRNKDESNLENIVEDCKLPLIDLHRLTLSAVEQESCKQEIANAAATHGFFQVINHGIPIKVLKGLQHHQMKLFELPFYMKASGVNFLNLPANTYRWGNPAAKSIGQFMWSEAFHLGVADISKVDAFMGSRSYADMFVSGAASLSKTITEILAQNLGVNNACFFEDNCSPDNCYLRMNRYPPCHSIPEVFGLMPHTDSDFLTILSQDEVEGLQLVAEDGRWYSVRPIPGALTINIGDLFEAWSNGVYKSVRHRVVTSAESERLSVAYFYCPSNETVIESCMSEQQPLIYKKFSFGEYKRQIQLDVQFTGDKIGLSRFYNI